MEGSGGILCPLRFDREELWLTDVIRACGLGCLLVADAGLGAINAVGLTASYLDRQGIPLKGIIFNRFQPGNRMHEDNVKLCEHLTGVRAAAPGRRRVKAVLSILKNNKARRYPSEHPGGAAALPV